MSAASPGRCLFLMWCEEWEREVINFGEESQTVSLFIYMIATAIKPKIIEMWYFLLTVLTDFVSTINTNIYLKKNTENQQTN